MAKWSGVYLQDCHLMRKKIEEWLENEVESTELTEKILCENDDDFIHFGRRECAEGLLEQIKKWRKEMFNEK